MRKVVIEILGGIGEEIFSAIVESLIKKMQWVCIRRVDTCVFYWESIRSHQPITSKTISFTMRNLSLIHI